MDFTEPNDIEYPDECPECGFEPADPDVLVSEKSEEIKNRASSIREQLDDAPFWIQQVVTSDDGSMTIKTVCPKCDTTVQDFGFSEEIASMMGTNLEE